MKTTESQQEIANELEQLKAKNAELLKHIEAQNKINRDLQAKTTDQLKVFQAQKQTDDELKRNFRAFMDAVSAERKSMKSGIDALHKLSKFQEEVIADYSDMVENVSELSI